jgi:hypothetical protein
MHTAKLAVRDIGPGSPAVVYGAECRSCGEDYWYSHDATVPEVWSTTHSDKNPGHDRFAFFVKHYWRIAER